MERLLAEERQKRRRVQLALAAAVGLLLLAGSAFAWWQDKQATEAKVQQAAFEAERKVEQAAFAHVREFQATKARDQITRSLALAVELRQQYRFHEAAEALNQASASVAIVPELAPTVEQAQANLTFARELDAIRFKKWHLIADADGKPKPDTTGTPPAYRAAFLARGFDIVGGDVGDIVRRMKVSVSRAELVDALNDWAVSEPDKDLRERILQLLREVDGPREALDQIEIAPPPREVRRP